MMMILFASLQQIKHLQLCWFHTICFHFLIVAQRSIQIGIAVQITAEMKQIAIDNRVSRYVERIHALQAPLHDIPACVLVNLDLFSSGRVARCFISRQRFEYTRKYLRIWIGYKCPIIAVVRLLHHILNGAYNAIDIADIGVAVEDTLHKYQDGTPKLFVVLLAVDIQRAHALGKQLLHRLTLAMFGKRSDECGINHIIWFKIAVSAHIQAFEDLDCFRHLTTLTVQLHQDVVRGNVGHLSVGNICAHSMLRQLRVRCLLRQLLPDEFAFIVFHGFDTQRQQLIVDLDRGHKLINLLHFNVQLNAFVQR
mmetsp:Transcript_26106/g.42660  ORF Transcript_26106/g.42660 Transcript_26106/m.42660 type:complete len:309 (-) Transcript_26106:399-1325(-)